MKTLIKFFLLTFLGVFGTSCGESSSDEPTTIDPQPETVLEPQETILYSVINDLNVRDEAGREGKVIAKLSYGQRTLFLDKETDYKERIIMRGSERFDTWKKVRFSSGAGGAAVEGWVYGGGMKEEKELFKKTAENLYERKLENITRSELSKIIGMTLTLDYIYNGSVNYARSGGSYVKHQGFMVTGLPKDRSNELKHVNAVYTGQFQEGKATGLFTKVFTGYESESKTTVEFDDGLCLWSEVKGSGEGEEWSNRIEHPAKCNFQFIENSVYETTPETSVE